MKLPNRTYDSDKDDVRSILKDFCQAIGKRGEFLVSGFGQESWPVSVETDLPVFLEQLPFVLGAIDEGAATEIAFYEQGIESFISLEPTDGKYVATCVSGTNWKPHPMMEEMDREKLGEMLRTVREEFIRAFSEAAPDLFEHPWVQQWLKGLPEHR